MEFPLNFSILDKTFIKNQIGKELKGYGEVIKKLLKDSDSKNVKKVDKVMKEVAANIMEGVKDEMTNVNETITKQLKIPDDVLMARDCIHVENGEEESAKSLQDEIRLMLGEIEQNARFIHSLNNEIERYESLAEIKEREKIVMGDVRSHLDNNLSPEILQHATRKLHNCEDLK